MAKTTRPLVQHIMFLSYWMFSVVFSLSTYVSCFVLDAHSSVEVAHKCDNYQ